MIVQDGLPGIKSFLRPAGLTPRALGLVIRCVAAFCLHFGRMSASHAAGAVAAEPRHRAQISRFLGRKGLRRRPPLALVRDRLLAHEPAGRFVFIVDQTLCSRRGDKTENTYATGNRQRRPRKGTRYQKNKYARKRCHCFVMGLLLTPGGTRYPFRRRHRTKEYCAANRVAYRKQTELAADLIRELPLPAGADVVVLGDTAFDAAVIRAACAARDYAWIVPMNPERVLAGPKPRPRVRLLTQDGTGGPFAAIRLDPAAGPYAAMRRRSAGRAGPNTKPRVYYAHSETRDVHSVGEVRLVFSTREQPLAGEAPAVQKILMSNRLGFRPAELVELYDLRWQIELFFKELKGTLGFAQCRLLRFEATEGWLELVLAAFLYLEWHRARQLAQAGLTAKQKDRWRRQRTHGLCLAVRRHSEQADVACLARALQTPGGIRRLRQKLRRAIPAEFRTAG